MAGKSIIYAETLSPVEQKDYLHDWSADLAEGETITTATESMIQAVAVSKVNLSHATPNTVITLTGGTHGARCIYAILIETSSGRKFEQVFELDVVDTRLVRELVIEDGSGKPDAECYSAISVTDAYWASREDEVWSKATVPAKRAAKLKAADYLNFGYRWRGQPLKYDQAGAWPRTGVVDANGFAVAHNVVPEQIKRAEHILAREALTVDISSQTEATSVVKSESVTVGGISESKTYDTSNRRPLSLHSFTHVDAVVAGLSLAAVGRSGFRAVPLKPV